MEKASSDRGGSSVTERAFAAKRLGGEGGGIRYGRSRRARLGSRAAQLSCVAPVVCQSIRAGREAARRAFAPVAPLGTPAMTDLPTAAGAPSTSASKLLQRRPNLARRPLLVYCHPEEINAKFSPMSQTPSSSARLAAMGLCHHGSDLSARPLARPVPPSGSGERRSVAEWGRMVVAGWRMRDTQARTCSSCAAAHLDTSSSSAQS